MSLFASILVVDDDKNTREGLKQFLEGCDYDVLTAENGAEGFDVFKKTQPDIVLTDVRMPVMEGTALLEKIVAENSRTQVILLTAYGAVDDAVKAMKKGAFYYLTKPVNLEELDFLIKKALRSKSLQDENQELREALYREKFETGTIIAESPRMKDVLKTVDQIALSNATVLIEGASGTGKELLAHRMHEMSPRHRKPFIAVHCAALTDSLLASELFGHEKGAFTGASERKVGRFERAHEGTLFLDEIGEISAETQVKLLRVLQEREFERVGGTKTIKVDVRLICATNKNLHAEVQAGRFREDLYYRLNVINLKVPSLKERREDIPVLVNAFVKEFSRVNNKKIKTVTEQAQEKLKAYDWPGNVRELKNIVERMVVLCEDDLIDVRNIPDDILTRTGVSLGAETIALPTAGSNQQLEDVEREFIKAKLKEAHGNKSLAAKKLGISRRTLYRKIEEYQLQDL